MSKKYLLPKSQFPRKRRMWRDSTILLKPQCRFLQKTIVFFIWKLFNSGICSNCKDAQHCYPVSVQLKKNRLPTILGYTFTSCGYWELRFQHHLFCFTFFLNFFLKNLDLQKCFC